MPKVRTHLEANVAKSPFHSLLTTHDKGHYLRGADTYVNCAVTRLIWSLPARSTRLAMAKVELS
jgi:hypothetical protein